MTNRSSIASIARSRRNALRIAVLGAAALLSAACSSDSSTVTGPSSVIGSFAAAISGSAAGSLKGPSAVFYAPASGTLGAAYLLRMADSASNAGIGIEWDDITSLVPGTYDLGIEANQATFLYVGADGTTAYDGTGGTITITDVTTAGLMSGSFNATALSRLDGTSTITVSGTFSGAPTILYTGQ